MITMREPQWGQGRSISSKGVVSSQVPSLCGDLVDGAIWGAAAMSWRARASFSARVMKALRQHVHEEPTNELAGLQRHGLVPLGTLYAVILVGEDDARRIG